MKHAIISYFAVLILVPFGLGCSEQKEEVAEFDTPSISPATYYAAGQVLEHQNDLMGAIHQYSQAIEADPRLTKAYNRLGLIFQKMNRIEDAQLILMQGIEENPDCAILRNNFGFCSLQRNNYSGAEQQFRKSLEIAPKFSQAWMNLGIALSRQGRFGESVASFQQVVPVEVAYTNVASVCIDMLDYEHAAWALRNALANNPDYAPAKDQVDDVTRLAQASRDEAVAAQKQGGWASLASYPSSDTTGGQSILSPPLGNARFADKEPASPHEESEVGTSVNADS